MVERAKSIILVQLVLTQPSVYYLLALAQIWVVKAAAAAEVFVRFWLLGGRAVGPGIVGSVFFFEG